MAKVTFKSYIKSAHGRLGNVIYYNVKGCQYARSYSIPRNPRTAAQQQNRATFADAVRAWQELPQSGKFMYNKMAMGQKSSGYNIFISMRMKDVTPVMLKMIYRTAGTFRLLSGYTQRATTSVISSSPVAYPVTNDRGTPLILKKPPGTYPEAA